jgi:hypothetical protein
MVKSREKRTGHHSARFPRAPLPLCPGRLPVKRSLRLAPAAALSAAVLVAACEKSAETSSTGSTTATTVTSSTGTGTSGYIDLPVYPAASENNDQGLSMSAEGSSEAMKVYTSKADAKTVAEWYKSHLPAAWKNVVLTADNKTIGMFTSELADGDQNIVVATQDDGTTRIQLGTKHGK